MGSHSVTGHPTQVNSPRLTPASQAGTRFTYPGGMEGWVDLGDLLYTEMVYPPADGHPSSTNRAQCRLTPLTTTLRRYPVGSKRRIFSASECVSAVQDHPRSMFLVFGTNRKRVCDFLLVSHCDYDSILHRFWDTAIYWLKIAYFSYPSPIRRPRCAHSLCSLWNFEVKLAMRKLESWGYPAVKTPRS